MLYFSTLYFGFLMSNINWKWAIGLQILALASCFAAGRYTAPVKVVTETKVVEKEVIKKELVTVTDQIKHRETTITEKTNTDGSKEKTTKIVEDTTTDKKSDAKESDKTEKKETDTKEVTKESSKLNIAAMAGFDFGSPTPVYGAQVTRTLIGPFFMGVWGLSNKTAGMSLGLSF